ncbi:MAG: hypothetical protein IPQ07_30945 [Myxococcales bacterium]|nr:hypothetical protein [Myxococcales bacterium]
MKLALAFAVMVVTVVLGAGCSADVSAEGKAAPKPAPSAKSTFKVGDRVDAKWVDDVYYEAKITKGNPDGTFAVHFDDGTEMERMAAAKLRVPVAGAFKQGDRVDAVWKGTGFYPGRVTKLNPDGTFEVTFDDDGTIENKLPATKLRAYVEDPIKAGDPVWGKWTDDVWYPGKVGAVNKDGTFKVAYTDGDTSAALPRAKVRLRDPATTPKAQRPTSSSSPAAEGGNCAGPGMPRRCNGVCTTIQDNDNNCGGCGNKCKAGYHCAGLFCRDAGGNL